MAAGWYRQYSFSRVSFSVTSCYYYYYIIIIIMQRLTRHVLVIRMTNRRRGVHVDLRVAVSVIKLFEFLFDVQVANDDVR